MSVVQRSLQIPADDVALQADLALPEPSRGLVLFAHGGGSSRHSPRNRFVAGELQRAGLATALADLLTVEEEGVDARTAELRFDISLLAGRVVALIDWLAAREAMAERGVGLFGASTGAAAALVAAAVRPQVVAAVVSRGGRPDLAGEALGQVRCPTLLIVGGRDRTVLELNRRAMEALSCKQRLEIVPGATHLFEEPGSLEQVARLACEWFTTHMSLPPG